MGRGKSNRKNNNNDNRNRRSNDNCNRRSNDNRNRNRNRKGKNNRMAIVHVAFKSSSQAPPAAAHAQYIARDGQYERRGGLEMVESGNMPEFAQADPFAFWAAADAHERANGRTYTEIQLALPRELGKADREQLAREATRELMGERFAYTMAIHVPLAKDNIDQPHMHLMFSERAVDAATRGLAEERFFKRNGAKKDPSWNDRNKPNEVRERWVALMNGAMEKAGIEQGLDARSWAEQGREDLAALREPKLLGGDEKEANELREKVEELRRQREELPPSHLSQAAAGEEIGKKAERYIVLIEKERDEQLSLLDRAIEKLRELATTAKEAIERKADRLLGFLSKVDAFDRKVDTELARQKEAEILEASRKPRVPDREELDRQLREIARCHARFPQGRIEPLEEVRQSEITGRVLGYTEGQEEALFQRLSGGLVRLDMRGRELLPIGKEIDYDPRSRGISLSRGGYER